MIEVELTERWLREFVVKFNICPFARQELDNNTIHYVVCDAEDDELLLEALVDECKFLDTHPEIATTLFILPKGLDDFEDFLNLLAIAEQLMSLEGYDGVYQLASFHPEYQFAGEPADDPANYTNRSPYPILHLLREEQMTEALEAYDDPESIPDRNIAWTRRKGHEFLQQRLAQILAGKA